MVPRRHLSEAIDKRKVNDFFAKATKYGAGITIFGDHTDLTNLLGTIYDLTRNTLPQNPADDS